MIAANAVGKGKTGAALEGFKKGFGKGISGNIPVPKR